MSTIMSAHVKPEPSEAESIRDSLDCLLTEITGLDARRAAAVAAIPDDGHSVYRVYSIADIAKWAEEDAKRTPAGQFADRMKGNPARSAMKHAITRLGERLHEIGGFELMQDACYAVASRDPSNESRRLSIVDSAWDGIGGEWWS